MKKRIFIAANLPETVGSELDSLVQELQRLNPDPAIRYIPTKNIHITLHFLGDIFATDISKISHAMRDVIRRGSPTTLESTVFDAFPNTKRPQVIFLGVKLSDSNLIRLQQELGRTLQQAGFTTDTRPWIPHLTLARVQRPLAVSLAGATLPKLRLPITTVELMESILTPAGSQYQVLETFSLGV